MLRAADPEPSRPITLICVSVRAMTGSMSAAYARARQLKTAAEEASPTAGGMAERIVTETEAGIARSAPRVLRKFFVSSRCLRKRLICASVNSLGDPFASNERRLSASAKSTSISTLGEERDRDREAAAGSRSSLLRLPQYLMSAMFGVERAVTMRMLTKRKGSR